MEHGTLTELVVIGVGDFLFEWVCFPCGEEGRLQRDYCPVAGKQRWIGDGAESHVGQGTPGGGAGEADGYAQALCSSRWSCYGCSQSRRKQGDWASKKGLDCGLNRWTPGSHSHNIRDSDDMRPRHRLLRCSRLGYGET